jgi:hypothetical protein
MNSSNSSAVLLSTKISGTFNSFYAHIYHNSACRFTWSEMGSLQLREKHTLESAEVKKIHGPVLTKPDLS